MLSLQEIKNMYKIDISMVLILFYMSCFLLCSLSSLAILVYVTFVDSNFNELWIVPLFVLIIISTFFFSHLVIKETGKRNKLIMKRVIEKIKMVMDERIVITTEDIDNAFENNFSDSNPGGILDE